MLCRRGGQILVFLGLTLWVSHCCSIVIPPVTLTGNKTAIEKQIIGEQNELEKDVWMVSSAKTTSRADLDVGDERELAEKQKDNTYTFEAFALMEIFNPKLAKLKADRVVGENKEGYVSNLLGEGVSIPDASKAKYDPRLKNDIDKGVPYRTLIETVKQINRARLYLVKGYILNQKKANPNFKGEEKALILQQKQKYHDATLKGEYVQADGGSWTLK